ncbi:protein CHUP1, chloroplastic-like isoform X1 [Canna indica]|uniref:Protein CHUP1, chloroplastic-like isoform X1 n=1 Tax=Canna indica TaxID=4628 RepID=A0AAQ3JM39_9LILI|nr:protein CHUP1, chloroplastic-like isoform X1 [Canna indica]
MIDGVFNYYCCKGVRMKVMLETVMEDRRPLLPRLCIALAVHLASYLICHLNFPISADTQEEDESVTHQKSSLAEARGHKDGLLVLQNEEDAPANIIHGTNTTTATMIKTETTTNTTRDITEQSPTTTSFADAEELNLDEDERGTSTTTDGITSKADLTTVVTTHDITEQPPKSSPKEEKLILEETEHEPKSDNSMTPLTLSINSQNKELKTNEEIVYLRNLVQSLMDRNINLETEMLEYYGLKEQEATVRELENRLKIMSVEAKCLTLKIESLKDENQQLKFQASESSSALMRELESARMKEQSLRRRFKSVHVQAREKIAALEKRISVLRDLELNNRREEADVQDKLNRLKELEEEATKLKKENSMLVQENLDLAQRLKSAETFVSSSLEGPQPQVLEEVNQLREVNEELKKKIEQIQIDRCTDVEELVYLRWLNACLRYEQRDHQPPPGKTIAKDLSKCSSPISEEKAKHLILHYAFADHNDDGEEYYSSDQESDIREFDAFDDSFLVKDVSSGKSNLLGKIKNLVSRKSSKKHNKISSIDTTPERRSSISSCSVDEEIRRGSIDSTTEEHLFRNHVAKSESHRIDGTKKKRSSWFPAACRSPLIGAEERKVRLEKDGKVARCKSDLGAVYNRRKRVSGDDNNTNQNDSFHEEAENVQINKYAEALLCSRTSPEPAPSYI